jgi:membrane-associated HD superfamily phosphohydrolase
MDLRAALVAPRTRMWVFVLATGLLTAAGLLLSPPSTVTYNVGTVATQALKAPRSVSFVSESLTEAERERAAAAVPKQYAPNPTVLATSRDRLAQAVATIARLRGDPTLSRDQKVGGLTRATEVSLTAALAADVIDMPGSDWDALSKELDNTLRSLYGQGIRAEQLDAVKAEAGKALPPAWNDRQKRVATEITKQFLDANVVLDPVSTAVAQQAARGAVAPVQVQVVAGEVVVRDGSVVSALDVEKLRALGLVNTGLDLSAAIGLIIWALLVAWVLGLFAERYATEAWNDDRKLTLIALALFAMTVSTRALVPGHTLLVYFMPYAAVAMTLTVLVSGRAALATQIAGALHAGIMSGQVELVAYVLVPALLGMAAVARDHRPRVRGRCAVRDHRQRRGARVLHIDRERLRSAWSGAAAARGRAQRRRRRPAGLRGDGHARPPLPDHDRVRAAGARRSEPSAAPPAAPAHARHLSPLAARGEPGRARRRGHRRRSARRACRRVLPRHRQDAEPLRLHRESDRVESAR